MMHARRISRRTVLRGLGAVIGLPLLEAMMPVSAQAPTAPRRMAIINVPNGITMDQWTPAGTARVADLPAELPNILQPLAPHRQNIAVLTGLASDPARAYG